MQQAPETPGRLRAWEGQAYSKAKLAAFPSKSEPILMYSSVVANDLCLSWRWIACPGALFFAAEVASPDLRE